MPSRRLGRPPIDDRYTSMEIDQLRAEVSAMFGINTRLADKYMLRYRLRRGERVMALGETPVWRARTRSTVPVPIRLVRQVCDALDQTSPHAEKLRALLEHHLELYPREAERYSRGDT